MLLIVSFNSSFNIRKPLSVMLLYGSALTGMAYGFLDLYKNTMDLQQSII